MVFDFEGDTQASSGVVYFWREMRDAAGKPLMYPYKVGPCQL